MQLSEMNEKKWLQLLIADGKPRIFTEADQIENFATHRKFDVTVTCITECRKK